MVNKNVKIKEIWYPKGQCFIFTSLKSYNRSIKKNLRRNYKGSGHRAKTNGFFPLRTGEYIMLYDEAKRINEEIRELCKDSKHPSRTMSKEVMRALNSELEKIRKRSKGSGGSRFSAVTMDQTQIFNMEKLKSFDVPAKYEKQLLKALEKAKEYAGIED